MRRNPLFIFQDLTSIGIYDVPLKSTVHIVDTGNGKPMFIQLVAKISPTSELNEFSTIADLLADPALYIDISSISETVSQLEAVRENQIDGWRLLGRDPDLYGNIGEGAVDFSLSDSFSGSGSGSGGATGNSSFALGFETLAAENNAIASGYKTTALGQNSFSSGDSTAALADSASAFGIGTKISNAAAMAIGQYNTDIVGTGTIFEIGVGINPTDRQNALSVYLDGSILAPKLEKALIIDNKSLTTKEYVDGSLKDTSGHLSKVSEGGKNGYRILDRDPDYYGDTGEQSVDLSSLGNTPTLRVYGATGDYAFASGYETIADGVSSHAGGQQTTAGGVASNTEGQLTTASGDASHAEGQQTTAVGNASHAEGNRTGASGMNSHAEGYESRTYGDNSHAEGYNTIADGKNSHAEGQNTHAKGDSSHAEGRDTSAVGIYSHASGQSTTAQNWASHAIGKFNIGKSDDTIMEVGIGDNIVSKNALEVYIGGQIVAPGMSSQNIYDETTGQILITKNYLTSAYNANASQLEKIENGILPGCGSGSGTGEANAGWRILGRDSSNYATIGCGAVDFSFSTNTPLGANGVNAFAEGVNTFASGTTSHAAGQNTQATQENQFVLGQFNDSDILRKSIFEIGIGTGVAGPDVTKNAIEVYKDGVILAPSLDISMITANKCLATKEYVLSAASTGQASQLEIVTDINGDGWRLLGQGTGKGTLGLNSVDFSTSTVAASPFPSALGKSSFITGLNTTASGIQSFAEGQSTKAVGINSHAFGNGTQANGINSISEGESTAAAGKNSHAAGLETQAGNDNQFVVGQYNSSTAGTLFEVGIGAAAASRVNALEVHSTGEVIARSMESADYTATTDVKTLTTKEYVDDLSTTNMLTIDNLVDVDTTTTAPMGDDVLTYDAVNNEWIAKALAAAMFTEVGGVMWKDLTIYTADDIVGWLGLVYVCISDHTAAGTDPSLDPTNWKLINITERGGIMHDGATPYDIGDIVTDNLSMELYRCHNNTSLPASSPSLDLTNTYWTLAVPGATEKGGVSWNSGIVYDTGDIVVDIMGGTAFTPVVSDEYPDVLTDGATQGDAYLVDGLGLGVTYTMTVGNLSGTIVSDGDRFTVVNVVDDEAGSTWNYTPAEKLAYICIAGHQALTGNNFDGSPSQPTQQNWKPIDTLSTFTDLPDTPNDYNSGSAGDFVVLNSGVNGLEFAPASSIAPTGLEVMEYPLASGDFGWKLIGRGPGSIGLGAVDFSLTNLASEGATGENSAAFGLENTAAGEQSAVFGNANIVNGDNSVAIGNANVVDDNQSMAVGQGLTTTSDNSVAVGQYNSNIPSVVGNVFEVGVGNGTFLDPGEFKNGLEIKIDGTVSAPALEIAAIDAYTDGYVLTTREYVNAKLMSSQYEVDFDVTVAGQTDFAINVSTSPTISPVEIYLNGTKLRMEFDDGINPVIDHDYRVVVTGPPALTTIVLSTGATIGDWVQVRYTA